jgi:gliding motility-associated-like protein
VADFNFIPGTGCAPVTINFINNSTGGTPYNWDFGDGSSSILTNASHTYDIAGTYNVRLNATGPDGIIVHKDTVVTVRQIPVAQFEVTPNTAFIPGNPVHYFNLSTGIDSLLWEFGDGTTSKDENPTYKYAKPGSYDVTLHVWSGFQCYDSLVIHDAVKVELAGIIKCPNAFTPNPNGPAGGNYNPNDFSNDVFHCLIEGAATYHLEIYNRLGIRLFESDDINIGWDGYYKGKLVESGAYVFRVNGKFNNGAPFSYFGNIVVIR